METVRFYTWGLLSKWGFQDGDLLFDVLYDQGIDLPATSHDDLRRSPEHELLISLVRDYVLPAIDQDVDVYEIHTIHNPIRARTVAGQRVDDHAEPDESLITPAYVDVPLDIILERARTLLRMIGTSSG